MSDTEQQSEAPEQPEQPEAKEQQEQTFTQADVDEITAKVRREERRKAFEKFSDYDDLKAKAGEAKTAEDRIADLEKRYLEAETRALRANIASEYGISAEDRDLFLTGSDEEALTAQAKRLAERESERKKRNNYAPAEGATPTPKQDERRAFADFLVGRT